MRKKVKTFYDIAPECVTYTNYIEEIFILLLSQKSYRTAESFLNIVIENFGGLTTAADLITCPDIHFTNFKFSNLL